MPVAPDGVLPATPLDGAWAHSPPEPGGTPHRLIDHLNAVGSLAATFAGAGDAAQWAAIAGRWHDLGKFRPGFQRYVRQDSDAHIEGRLPASSDKSHSAAGALHALTALGEAAGPHGAIAARALAYVIAGHHAGLADWHASEGGTTGLSHRLHGGGAEASATEYREALAVASRQAPEMLRLPADFDLRRMLAAVPAMRAGMSEPLGVSLWIRMLFSALVDADFLDTEAFFDGDRSAGRVGHPRLDWYRERLAEHLARLRDEARAAGRIDDPVMVARAGVLADCLRAAETSPGVFELTVPTGGGKTLASLAFALDHAHRHGLQRVIVAIPYTSIVEQTADVLRGVFGDEQVVEHHSQADVPARGETARSRLACENWDAPLVVTTNVQLLESLFAAGTSRCRKLHRIARSVIVLDEAQLLPPAFLQPILDTLRLLVTQHGSTVVLCTATQPVLTDTRRFDARLSVRGLPSPHAIVPDTANLYRALERVRFEWPVDFDRDADMDEIAEAIARQPCGLVVVNTRRDASDLVRKVDRFVQDLDGDTVHLSAAMCGQHRADVITSIRARLSQRASGGAREPLRVVSTQLVEAGVDLDFPCVWRALAGLDSIAQAAGRCNREGLLGHCGGTVRVFVRPVPRMLATLVAGARATAQVLHDQRPEVLTPEHFTRYFRIYHDSFRTLDAHGIVDLLTADVRNFAIEFATAADRFRLIDEDMVPLVVRYVPRGMTTSPADAWMAGLDRGQVDRWRLRRLQRYLVQIRRSLAMQWLTEGTIREVIPGLFALVDDLRYDLRFGLLDGTAMLDAATLVQ